MSLSVPVAPKIPQTRSPAFPQFVFEYHEHVGKVYVVEVPGEWVDGAFVPKPSGPAQGTCIAEHCDTMGRFYGFVQTYLRGYRKAQADQKGRLT